ncbi:DUF1707 SHOCT-like domain-containing protein [Nocardia jejuensis]|uniref:DUF1707 SHOCT-like domain-containing protein n=1 Tax=Nocardia jejuensis TaxID=328049 RepID=UPI0012FBC110|nr:DUF1707 domain-containing protein [Nocardia jejuensis]
MSETPDARVGDNEREHALQELSQHFSVGRLTAAEFEERSTRVWTAGTHRQLAETFVDLPASPVLVPGSARVHWPAMAVRAGAVVIFAVEFWLSLDNPAWLLLLGAVPVVGLILTRSR